MTDLLLVNGIKYLSLLGISELIINLNQLHR